MSNFFGLLHEKKKLGQYCEVLDWLFDESLRFANWKSKYTTNFTKKIKKLFCNCSKFDTKETIDIAYEKQHCPSNNYVIMKSGSSEGKEIVRHIRNSIAHGNVKIISLPRQTNMEMIDKKKDGKTITFYSIIDLKTLNCIYQEYRKTEVYYKLNLILEEK